MQSKDFLKLAVNAPQNASMIPDFYTYLLYWKLCWHNRHISPPNIIQKPAKNIDDLESLVWHILAQNCFQINPWSLNKFNYYETLQNCALQNFILTDLLTD